MINEYYQGDQPKYSEDLLEILTAVDEKEETNKTWRIIHILSGKKRQGPMKVKRRDGSDPSSQQDLTTEWKEYFSTLLNNTPVLTLPDHCQLNQTSQSTQPHPS